MKDWLSGELEKVNNKLDKLDNKFDDMHVTQAEIKKDLHYHIKRTDILEHELKPIVKKHFELKGIMKFLGAVVGLAGLLEVIIRAFVLKSSHL